MKNWKTTLSGFLIFCFAGAAALWPQHRLFIETLGALFAGFGLIAAQDAGKEE